MSDEPPNPAGHSPEAQALFTAGKSIPVEVGAIEKELAAFWREASASAQRAGDRLAVTRACLWNLVIRTEGDEELRRIKQLVDDLSPALPARVVVLALRSDAGNDALRAWVESNCRVGPRGEREICAEEVTIEAAGRAIDHLPALVRGLLVPDVPTALYWPCDPPDHAHPLARALESVDRLVVDTGDVWSPGSLRDLTRLGETFAPLDLCDLAWLRAHPLRSAIASLFDPPRAPELGRLERVTVACVRHREPAALLYLGWLAAQLDLGAPRPIRGTGGQRGVAFPRSGGAGRLTASLDVREDTGDGGPLGGLLGATLTTPAGVFAARLGEREADGRHDDALATGARVELLAPGEPARSQRFAGRPEVDLLAMALGAHGADPFYERALARAAEIAAVLGG